MGSIQKRIQDDGAVRYRALVRLKGFSAQSATFPNISKARHWIQNTEVELRDGRYFGVLPGNKITLKKLIGRYRREILPDLKSRKSLETHLRFWQEKLGHKVLTDLTTADIISNRSMLRSDGRTPATCNRYVATIRQMLNIAKRSWGLISKNPAEDVEAFREPRGRERFLSDRERKHLLKTCQEVSHDLYVAVVLALATGARKTEIWSLTWRQIDLKEDRITFVETKNDTSRSVPLIDPAKRLLIERRQNVSQRPKTSSSPYVFPAVKNRKEHFDFTYHWRKALKLSRVKDFRWHDLRHTAACYLASAGASDFVIAQVLGHRTLQMVKRYSHLRVDNLRDSVGELTKRLEG
ncbi:MAG TPA: site-specific integrase [Bacteroidetes bacterium]|nr:site-specific tyrosine recombinase XerC [bacterium BMS3Bbin04]HDO65906.1 site-specific integrase [Bacteroidota bacterium]HEX05031.1 site-specific integrase [Bacteroidota bacterium]